MPDAVDINFAAYRLIHPRSLFVEPFLGSGYIAGTDFEVIYNERLYPSLARVLATGPDCRDVQPGDVVILDGFMCYDTVRLLDGTRFAVMNERHCAAILEGYDDTTRYKRTLTGSFI